MRSIHGLRLMAVAAAACLGSFGQARAASQAYPGPIVTADGTYDNIVETSITADPLPLFGAPVLGAGNVMTFPSPGFSASASDGSSDLTGGALAFTIDADPGLFINTVSIFESGAYDIVGAGSVSATGALTVRYLDNLTQQLVTLVDPIHTVVSPGGVPDGPFPVDGPGTGTWLGAALIDLGGLGIQTTHVIVALDNNLAASAPAGGTATISKDELTVNTTYIPEPASLALIAAGLLMVTGRRS